METAIWEQVLAVDKIFILFKIRLRPRFSSVRGKPQVHILICDLSVPKNTLASLTHDRIGYIYRTDLIPQGLTGDALVDYVKSADWYEYWFPRIINVPPSPMFCDMPGLF
jgi:hypothetical protein